MISTYMKNKIQDYLFTGVTFTPPAKYYIALSKTAPNAAGSNVTEPVNMGYSRVGIDKNTASFTTSSDGVVKNKIRLNYGESTGDWGNITHYAVFDAATGGNMLWANTLIKTRNIQDEMQLFIDPNGLTFTLGN